MTSERENIIVLVADWISLKDMLKLHELSPTASGALKTWLEAQILDSLDDKIWNDMSEEWANSTCTAEMARF